MAGFEFVWGHREAEESDEAVGGNCWDTTGRNQGRERNLAGKDGAQNCGPKNIHDRDGIPRLFGTVDFPNPRRHRKNAITRNGED